MCAYRLPTGEPPSWLKLVAWVVAIAVAVLYLVFLRAMPGDHGTARDQAMQAVSVGVAAALVAILAPRMRRTTPEEREAANRDAAMGAGTFAQYVDSVNRRVSTGVLAGQAGMSVFLLVLLSATLLAAIFVPDLRYTLVTALCCFVLVGVPAGMSIRAYLRRRTLIRAAKARGETLFF